MPFAHLAICQTFNLHQMNLRCPWALKSTSYPFSICIDSLPIGTAVCISARAILALNVLCNSLHLWHLSPTFPQETQSIVSGISYSMESGRDWAKLIQWVSWLNWNLNLDRAGFLHKLRKLQFRASNFDMPLNTQVHKNLLHFSVEIIHVNATGPLKRDTAMGLQRVVMCPWSWLILIVVQCNYINSAPTYIVSQNVKEQRLKYDRRN